MQKWELKRLFIPGYAKNKTPNKGHLRWEPYWGEDTIKAFAEADALAEDGWELVGIAPEIQGHEQVYTSFQRGAGAGSSYTSGYLFMFKRPKL